MIQKTPANTKRIEYIDALRGFTMLLVVMGHVTVFINGINELDVFSFSDVIYKFHMPLFFFISGFVLYKDNFIWNFQTSREFIMKKITVLIFSPLLFLVVSSCIFSTDLYSDVVDVHKHGYWFTFSLFEYYIIYIFLNQVCKLLNITGRKEDVFLISFALLIHIATDYGKYDKWEINEVVSGVLGIQKLFTFFFFVLGTRIKKHFNLFTSILDSKYFTMACVILFIILLLPTGVEIPSTILKNLIISTTGIVITFALFRSKKDILSSKHHIGRIAQYVGQHTLDIYLIHYLFIYSTIFLLKPFFEVYYSPFLEFVVSASIATVVICCSLAVSLVLRLNPLMAHWLFGAKMPTPQ